MKTILKITAGILLAGTLLIGGCAALIGAGASSVKAEQDAHAITKAQLDSISMGTSKDEVVATLGEPDNTQHSESSSYDGGTDTSDCIYYPVKGGEFLDDYQLCFENGKLRSKNKW